MPIDFEPEIEFTPDEPAVDFEPEQLQIAPEALPPKSPEELAQRRHALMKMTGAKLEGEGQGVMETLTRPLVQVAQSVTPKQLADAVDVLAISGAQAEGVISPDEAAEAMAEPSRKPSKTEAFLAGAQQATANAVNFFTSPLGIATLGTVGAPVAIQKAVAAAFVADMSSQFPDMVRELSSGITDGDHEKIGRSLTGMGLNTVFIKKGLESVFSKGKAIESAAIAEARAEGKLVDLSEPSKPLEFAPEPTSEAAKRVESKVAFEPPTDERTLVQKAGEIKELGISLFVDDLRPLERAEREMSGGELAEGATSPTKVARITTQAAGARAREWATEGMTDFAGNKTGPGLKEIFAREGIAGDERSAMLFAVARRAVELHEREIHPGIEKADALATVAELGTPARLQFAEEVRAWNEGALKYLADAGGISPEALTRITALNQAYIPFFRVFSEAQRGFSDGGRRIGDTPNAVKSIKGSERQIVNPLESMMQHANQIISVADKVRVANSLVGMAERGDFTQFVRKVPPDKVPVEFDIERVRKQLEDAGVSVPEEVDAALTIWRNSPRKPTGQNIVSFVRDGKTQHYELHPELYRAVQALDYQRIHPLLDTMFGKAARTIRLGATGIRAGFTLITNPVRDFSTMLLQSRGNPVRAAMQWGKHMAKQIGLKDSEIKELWKSTGGEMSQPLGLDRRTLQTAVDEVMANSAGRQAMNVLKHPVETVRRLLSFTEAAPRLAEFEMTLREMGWKPGTPVTPDMAVEAALRAAEVTVNFRRAGSWGRTVNQMVAFFNPAVQGLSKFGRSHQENPVGSVARGIGFITMPALANWWMNKDDQEWRNLPNWVKYGFLNFKIMDEWVRIPMPFDWWYAYGAIPLASMEAINEKEPLKLQLAMKEILEQVIPPVLPSVLVPPLEVAMNKSFFTDRPVVPEAQKRLLPPEQALPSTSETAKKVAEILSVGGVEVSPIHIDHIMSGETGGLWRDIVSTSERLAGVSPQRESLEPADIPIAGRLFIRDNASAVIDEFYTELEHVRQKRATWKKLLSEGSSRAGKYELTESQMQTYSIGARVEKALANMREGYRDAKSREERQEIFKAMEELAGTALGVKQR